jgi:hypothetical protein
VLRGCVICAVIAASPAAIAGGLVVTSGSPRAIGRAGAGTVGDDGGGALVINPAAIARRDGTRAQIGFAFFDDELAWQSDSPDAPIARDQAPSSVAPIAAALGSIGPWVIGAAVMTTAVQDRALRPPRDLPPSQFGVAFDYRYAGIAGSLRRDTVAVGAARRIGDSFAVGLSLSAARVSLTEVRRIWAGFGGRDGIASPEQDVEIAFAGEDRFVPSAVAGVLIAPGDSSLELGASIAWTQTLEVDADVGTATTPPMGGPTIPETPSAASLRVRQPVTMRAAGRYLGERFVIEVGGELSRAPRGSTYTTWGVEGMRVVDRSTVEATITRVPSRISLRTHGAIRSAVDVELIGGFLWATVGYAYAMGAVAESRLSPVFGDLGGHTLGLGLEATAGGFTATLGWSRTWASARSGDQSALELDNPFRAGDRSVPDGVYDGSSDQIGVLLDVEL